MGKIAMNSAIQLIQGKSIPDEIPVGIDLVTKENVDNTSKPNP
jgi:ABC-type sugar transport system substrate-binding protein